MLKEGKKLVYILKILIQMSIKSEKNLFVLYESH